MQEMQRKASRGNQPQTRGMRIIRALNKELWTVVIILSKIGKSLKHNLWLFVIVYAWPGSSEYGNETRAKDSIPRHG